MAEKLFYEDSHMVTFTAEVLECLPEGNGYKVRLDQTAFFPEGGGQYADTGMLEVCGTGGVSGDSGRNCRDDSQRVCRVSDVQESGGMIWHMTEQPLNPGDLVTGTIDWQERFMKMQQHTGEHIVSGLVHARFGYNNVGFHLGSEDCTMDFNGEITKEELHEIERLANEAVVKNLDVQVTYPTQEELETLEYRSKIEIEGQVRIVTIPGYDVCACCAPHVEKTGEIGIIKLTNIQRYKGGVRITMLCGFRALEDYDKKSASVKQISASMCAPENEIAAAVEHLKEECAELKRQLAEQKKAILAYKAEAVEEQEEFVCLFEEDLEGEGPRFLMNRVLDKGHALCAVFSGSEEGGYRYVIGSKALDMRKLVKELNEQFEGRGGGRPEMVQGSLRGNEKELRAWVQKKARMLKNE